MKQVDTAEKKVTSSPHSVSSQPDLSNHIPPVSSFIKNSDALLHPSSPEPSPLDLVVSQPDVYNRSRHLSNIERHSSISNITTTGSSEQSSALNIQQKSRSSSLTADRFLNSPGISISPPHFTSQHIPQEAQIKPFQVKSEVLDYREAIKTEWTSSNNVRPSTNVFLIQNNHSAKFCNDVVTDININDRVPTNGNAITNESIVPKQEKLYSPDYFISNHCGQLQGYAAHHSQAQHPFPRSVNFSQAPQQYYPDLGAHQNHAFIPKHVQQQHTQHNNALCTPEHIHPFPLPQHRHHPYMAVHSNFPAAVNGTIPYRPRYSRRNNPDLEKKRVHKCNHPGK